MRIAALLVAVLAVPGCETIQGWTGGGTAARATAEGGATAAGRRVERDVEAPEIFEREEAGLWDGRPSLGGVWVAHPEAQDPERVLIRTEGGASVAGALFRRERDHPGPRFQISSEAAAALGILPGQPTRVRVTAVRLQEVAVAPPDEPEPESPEDAAAVAADATGDPAAEVAPAADAAPAPPGGLRGFFQRLRPTPTPPPAPPPDAELEPALDLVPEPATRGLSAAAARLR